EAATGLWPAGGDPIGKRIRLDELKRSGGSVLSPTNSSPYVTVVGVVGNTRNASLRDETRPVALVPYTLLAPPQRVLAFRSHGDPKLLLNPLRAQVREMDKEQPLGRPTTIEDVLGRQTVQPRFIMALFSLFASLGLVLAAAGIYSVLTHLVTRRTHEIGVRIALGAQRADVLGMVFKAGGRLVGAGAVIGVLAGFGAARFLRSQLELFQVSLADPLSFLGVVVLLSAIT